MTRYLAFAGVVALTLLPAIALGAPPGGLRPHHPAPPPISSSGERSGRDRFQVPFEVNVQPKGLPERAQPPAMKWSPEIGGAAPDAYRRGWRRGPYPGYLWYQPAWYQPACYLNGAFNGPSASMGMPPEVTIGSLVDKNSENLFSFAPSPAAGMTSSGGGAGTGSGSLGAQYEFQTTPCGTTNFINF